MKVKLVTTSDHYSSVTHEFEVEWRGKDSRSPEQDARLDALQMLVDFYRTRVGTRVPLPREKLVVEFVPREEMG